ncbi:MAG: AbrB family transcriptional regulator [Actinobacteria bacterium]|nr:MAG: AbrB family transcriptional regulator [Actinomycetota bacterium]
MRSVNSVQIAVLAAAILGIGVAFNALGVPSPYLFAALLVGLTRALTIKEQLILPRNVFVAAQAVTGVALGTYLQRSSLHVLADDWLAVALVSLATLALSLAAGAALARLTVLDRPTAALGMIAGGASGIVGISDDLGGDDRLVAFMQYLRVLVVVLITPLLVAVIFPGAHVGSAPSSGPILGMAQGWLLTIAIAIAGQALRLPARALLGPLLIAGALTLTGAIDFTVPPLLRETGFAVIGLYIGLRFTIQTVRMVGKLLIPTMTAIVALLVACFALAIVLNATTSVSLEDAYLATTPGGLYAVLAVAFGAGANTTFIVAVQSLRVLVMVVLAPLAVRRVLRPS